MMDLIPKRTAPETNRVLEKIYHESIGKCIDLIKEFDQVILTDKPFHERFECTFKDNVATTGQAPSV